LTSITQEKIEAIGNGGLSGAPLHKKNIELVRYVNTRSEGKLPIIGVGGIMSGEDAKEMLDAGASLVEIYSGFIFEGPGLVKRIIKYLEK
jgi:dihydroorotate dehydrogenase